MAVWSVVARAAGDLDRVPGSVNGGDPVELLGKRQKSARILDVEALDQPAIHQYNPFAGAFASA